LAAVRDTVRLLTLPKGLSQEQRAVVVLNRVGMPGGLTRRQIEEALKMKVDVAIPDQPRQIGNAATLGEAAIKSSAGFRAGIQELARQVAGFRIVDTETPQPNRRGGSTRPRGRSLWSRRKAAS
jgi:pilus assembly protein CpaE